MQHFRQNSTFYLILIIIILGALVLNERRVVRVDPTPTPSPTPTVWIEGIRALAELSTVEYRAVAEVPNTRVPDDVRKFFGAKEEVLMLVYGTVKAGFDLSKLSGEDLFVEGNRVQLALPSPEILSLSVDNERTHVVYYEKSLLIGRDINFEGQTRQIADEALRQGAIEAGILQQAGVFGKLFFENHLRSLGFTDVRVVVK